MTYPPKTLERYLRNAARRLVGSETPHLDVRVLAKAALGLDDAGLILSGERLLTDEEMSALDALLARRALGESVAHIVGEKEFFGLNFRLAPGVLAPRPDSETLITAAMARRSRHAELRILDLGTGTGCLLCALLTAFPKASGLGVDLNEAAVALAAANANSLGLGARAAFGLADWSHVTGAFDPIVANPPYVKEGERARLAPEIREFEDARALYGGADGLDAYRSLLAAVPRLAAPGALIIFELGAGYESDVGALARRAFARAAIAADPDLSGRPRALAIDLAAQKKD